MQTPQREGSLRGGKVGHSAQSTQIYAVKPRADVFCYLPVLGVVLSSHQLVLLGLAVRGKVELVLLAIFLGSFVGGDAPRAHQQPVQYDAAAHYMTYNHPSHILRRVQNVTVKQRNRNSLQLVTTEQPCRNERPRPRNVSKEQK